MDYWEILKAFFTILFFSTIVYAIWESVHREKPKSKALILLEEFTKKGELTKDEIIELIKPKCWVGKYIKILENHYVEFLPIWDKYMYITYPKELSVDRFWKLVSNYNNKVKRPTLSTFLEYIK